MTAKQTRSRKKTGAATVDATQHLYDTLIIGSGFGGIGAAIKLREQGIHNIAILERHQKPGGTWRDNQYPGAACDVPSNLYSFSFAPNPNWSRTYSGSREIYDYVLHLISHYQLQPLIRFQQT